MKDRKFSKYMFAGVTAVTVIAVSILLVFLFLEKILTTDKVICDNIDKKSSWKYWKHTKIVGIIKYLQKSIDF